MPANNARFLWTAGAGSDSLAGGGGGTRELNAMLLASGHSLPPSITSAMSFTRARSVDRWLSGVVCWPWFGFE